MSHNIKCPKCNTWNENRDYCSQCNYLLNYQIRKEEEAIQKQTARKKDKLDLFFDKIKHSDNPFERVLYWMFRSVWFLLLAFASVAIAFTALGPG